MRSKTEAKLYFLPLYSGTRFLIKSEYLEKANKQTQASAPSVRKWRLRVDSRSPIAESKASLAVSVPLPRQTKTNKQTRGRGRS